MVIYLLFYICKSNSFYIKTKSNTKMEMARKEGKEEVKEEREELVPDVIKRKLRGLPKPT